MPKVKTTPAAVLGKKDSGCSSVKTAFHLGEMESDRKHKTYSKIEIHYL